MQLPKHKLQVKKASRSPAKTTRSNKHKKSRDRVTLPTNITSDMVTESDEKTEKVPLVVEKQEMQDSMEAAEVVEKIMGSTSGKSKPTNMKSKDEKKAIR